MYHIHSIGYYLFYRTILCGDYSRATTIREQRLFLSALLGTAEVEESDPFADVEEDENKLEENEAVLEDW